MTDNREKFIQSVYSLSFLNLQYVFWVFFGESLENSIFNNRRHEMFQFNKNYRFL